MSLTPFIQFALLIWIWFFKDLYNRGDSFIGWLLKLVDGWGPHVAVGSHLLVGLDGLFAFGNMDIGTGEVVLRFIRRLE